MVKAIRRFSVLVVLSQRRFFCLCLITNLFIRRIFIICRYLLLVYLQRRTPYLISTKRSSRLTDGCGMIEHIFTNLFIINETFIFFATEIFINIILFDPDDVCLSVHGKPIFLNKTMAICMNSSIVLHHDPILSKRKTTQEKSRKSLVSRAFLASSGTRAQAWHPNVRGCATVGCTPVNSSCGVLERPARTTRFRSSQKACKHSAQRLARASESSSMVLIVFLVVPLIHSARTFSSGV